MQARLPSYAARTTKLFQHSLGRRVAWLLMALASLLFLASCGSGSGSNTSGSTSGSTVASGFGGTVMGGRQPIVGSAVLVYSASLTAGTAPQEIGNATTDVNGRWNVATLSPNPTAGQLVYVVALGGNAGGGANNPNAALMTAAVVDVNGNLPAAVNMTELSTVATTAQLQSFITEVDCSTISGTSISTTGQNCPSIVGATNLASRAGTIANLVNVVTGYASTFLTSNAATSPSINNTLQNLNFQASVLAACINSNGGVAGDSSACGNLFSVLAGQLISLGTTAVGTAPHSVATVSTANGPFAFAANQSSNTLSVLGINSSGSLTADSSVGTDTFPYGVAASPSGQFVFAANLGSNTVDAYTFNSSTGTLTEVGSYAAGNAPYAVAVSPNNAFVYVSNDTDSSVSAYTITPGTGVLTAIGAAVGAGANPFSVAVSPNGAFAYVADAGGSAVSAFTIDENPLDSTYGALTPLTPTSAFATGTQPYSVTVSPNGQFVYVANDNASGSGSISAFSIDETATDSTYGALTPIGTYGAGTRPFSVTVSPNGNYAYVACYGSNTVEAYTINSSTGALTELGAFATGTSPASVAVSPSGDAVYVANNGVSTVSAFSVSNPSDTLTAALQLAQLGNNASVVNALFALSPLPPVYTPIPSSTPTTMAVGGTEFAYVANEGANTISAYTVTSTGTLTPVTGTLATSTYAAGSTPTSVAVSPNGAFAFVTNKTGGSTVESYTIDPGTGALTEVGTVAADPGPTYVTVSPSGQYAYVVTSSGDTVDVYSINSSTGALTETSSIPTGTAPDLIAISANGQYAYVTNESTATVSAYTIDSSSGALTAITGSPFATAGTFPISVALSPNGNYAFVVNEGGTPSVKSFSISSGALTEVSSATTGTTPYSIAVSPNGAYAYVVSAGTSKTVEFYSIQSTGALSNVGTVATGTAPRFITLSPNGKFAYVVNSSNIYPYSINSGDGALTRVGTVATGSTPYAIAISP